MKNTCAVALLLTCFLPGALCGVEAANPLGKVIELLNSLTAKITKEGEEEAKAYSAFVEWCTDAARTKGFEIKTATSAKDKLEADIAQETGAIEASSSRIDDLAGSIGGDDADLKSATTIRAKETADFTANEAELVDVIDTLGRATGILEREMQKNPAAFAQVDTSSIKSVVSALSAIVDAASFSSADKQKLLAMVQSQQNAGADDDDFGAPAAAVYKTHSTNILDVLEDLKEKAEEQLSSLRKAETNTRHNFEMLKQSLEDQISADTKALGEEKSAKAAATEAKATAEGDLAGTVKDLADAQAALAMTKTDCMQVGADHEATVASRAEELKAIADARKVLASSTGGAVDQTYSFFEAGAVSHFNVAARSALQNRADLASIEVVTIVKKLAKEQHSAALAHLASRISAVLRFGASAGEDPFAKVRALISDMINKLEAQAGSEATEKAYCDEQIAKTEEKKAELSHDLSKLTSKIDVAAAKSAGLKADVKELQAELATLAKQQAEMNQIRQESHAAFVQAKADLEEGLEGVRKALSVLREYYGGSASMLQNSNDMSALMQQPSAPSLHEKASGAGTSVIGILEVVESDFAKNLATEETEEDNSEAQYQKTTQMNKVTKTLKDQDVKYKSQEHAGLDKNIAELSADRETSDAELSAVLEYDEKIKARCIAKPETYAERKGRREAEVAGLKEALAILEDETAFTQRSKKGNLRAHFLA